MSHVLAVAATDADDPSTFDYLAYGQERHHHDLPPIAIKRTRIAGSTARIGARQSNGQDGPRRILRSASIAHCTSPGGLPPRRSRVRPGPEPEERE